MIWKVIIGHEGYSISDTGLIKRKEKTIIMEGGKTRHYKEKIYKFKKYGYAKLHNVTVSGGAILTYEKLAPLYFDVYHVAEQDEANRVEIETVNGKVTIKEITKQEEVLNGLRDRFKIRTENLKTLCEWEVEFYAGQLKITVKELEIIIKENKK